MSKWKEAARNALEQERGPTIASIAMGLKDRLEEAKAKAEARIVADEMERVRKTEVEENKKQWMMDKGMIDIGKF